MFGFKFGDDIRKFGDDIRITPDDLQKNGNIMEIVKTDDSGACYRDTVFVIPLNTSEAFREKVYPWIKEGYMKVEKNKNAPKL